MGTFPSGRPATERPPRPAANGQAKMFVLGVYPSALHVRWCRPDGSVHVQSLAVDDEPEVFWDGADAEERVARYGKERHVWTGDRALAWLPLKHPGQRTSLWEEHHRRWANALVR